MRIRNVRTARHPPRKIRLVVESGYRSVEAQTGRIQTAIRLADDAAAAFDMISLFLDLDGTLIDLAGTPEAVLVPPHLPQLLAALDSRFKGALALASGRNIASLDRLLVPYIGAAIGVHGIEYREPQGSVQSMSVSPLQPALFAEIVDRIGDFSHAFIEEKGIALAVHFHGEPLEMSRLESMLALACKRLQPDWRCLPGHRVIELKPAGIDKGVGLERMMTVPPFLGTKPVAIGDDITDLDLLAAARKRKGLAITVGNRIANKGDCHLSSPAEVLRFLDLLILAPQLDNTSTVAELALAAAGG